jgi:hypothetical protein
MLAYNILSNDHPKLEGRIRELEKSLAPIFPELSDVTLRVRMKRLRRAIAEYDSRTLRIDVDPRQFEPDPYNILPSVLAHETMHAVQHFDRTVPYGERSCDVFMLARLPSELYPKNRDFYVKVPTAVMSPEKIAQTARKALELREKGKRNYIVWFETELRALAN